MTHLAGQQSTPPELDGRVARRLDSMDSVRRVIIEMLDAQEDPDGATIALRAKTSERSIYRNFGHLSVAIEEAREQRLECHVAEYFALGPIDPLGEKLRLLDDKIGVHQIECLQRRG